MINHDILVDIDDEIFDDDEGRCDSSGILIVSISLTVLVIIFVTKYV
jgi:hypothetical protein